MGYHVYLNMIRSDEYWAGAFDGDGWMGLAHGGTKPLGTFTMCHKETVRSMHADMNEGCVNYSFPPSARRPNWNPRWVLTMSGNSIHRVAARLAPYFIYQRPGAISILGYDPPSKPRGAAYWAGLFDAEAYVGMPKNQGTPRPEVTVKMTCEQTIRECSEFFGLGAVDKVSTPDHLRGQREKGHTQQWRWRVKTRQALQVLEVVRPFLLTKAERCEMVMTYA